MEDFSALCGEVVTVSSDASGICIEELEKSGAQVVYVMPSHQYPTGRMMPIGRRTELLNWAAREKERYIIEDDYDSEFRYRGKPVPSLQASDAAGKVIYMGTFFQVDCTCNPCRVYGAAGGFAGALPAKMRLLFVYGFESRPGGAGAISGQRCV